MSIDNEIEGAIDVHFGEDGYPVISFNGSVISQSNGIEIMCEAGEFNTAVIRCMVNLKPDDSHIIK